MKKLAKTNNPGRGFDIVVDGQTDGGTDKTSSTVTLIDVWIVAFYGCVSIHHIIWIFYLDINIRIFYIVNLQDLLHEISGY